MGHYGILNLGFVYRNRPYQHYQPGAGGSFVHKIQPGHGLLQSVFSALGNIPEILVVSSADALGLGTMLKKTVPCKYKTTPGVAKGACRG